MSKKRFISLFPNGERKSEKSPLLFGVMTEETTKGRKTSVTEWSVSLWPKKGEPQNFTGSLSLMGERETEGRITLNFAKKVKSEAHPIGKGKLTFNDDAQEYEFAVWGRTSEKGRKYFSGQWHENEQQEQAAPEDYEKGINFIDSLLDDLPF